MARGRFIEVKRRLDGSEERFECELVHRTDSVAVVSFRLPAAVGDVPKGSTTFGWFWSRRPYNLYRFMSRDGDALLHRFDVLDEVRIGDGLVEYLDLIVDVLVSPTGEVTIEDEDELTAAARRGRVDEGRVDAVERALTTITRDWRRIVREALAVLPDDA
ncbi:MAG TPA: DUF402 domain-containing protein [Actinomycetota bacterium]|jgi:hypothetical protein